MGGSTTVDAAPTAEILAAAAQRMSLSAVGRHLGTSHTWVAKVIRGDIKRINPERAALARSLRTYRPTDTSHVNPLGARRRLQALHALGYTWRALAVETGYSLTGLKAVIYSQFPVMEAANDQAIRDTYDRLSMILPTSDNQHVRSGIGAARNNARRRGWLPPLAWDDIDDPTEHPGMTDCHDLPDPVVVERILAGDWRLRATPAERAEVVARWTGSLNQLERLTGWNVHRDQRERSVA
jgi:hypothetical protein